MYDFSKASDAELYEVLEACDADVRSLYVRPHSEEYQKAVDRYHAVVAEMATRND